MLRRACQRAQAGEWDVVRNDSSDFPVPTRRFALKLLEFLEPVRGCEDAQSAWCGLLRKDRSTRDFQYFRLVYHRPS